VNREKRLKPKEEKKQEPV